MIILIHQGFLLTWCTGATTCKLCQAGTYQTGQSTSLFVSDVLSYSPWSCPVSIFCMLIRVLARCDQGQTSCCYYKKAMRAGKAYQSCDSSGVFQQAHRLYWIKLGMQALLVSTAACANLGPSGLVQVRIICLRSGAAFCRLCLINQIGCNIFAVYAIILAVLPCSCH
jgi:hypothetical protein